MNKQTQEIISKRINSIISLLECLEMSMTGLFSTSDCSCEHHVISEIQTMVCEISGYINKEIS